MKNVTTAFVMGAGLGTRLRPLTETWPKPLLQVQGQPMITHVFERLARNGIQRFIVNTHHAPSRWSEVFPDNRWKGQPIELVHEDSLLGTAGGLKNIEALLGNDPVLLHSGDVVTNLPIEPLLQTHATSGAEVTLAVRYHPGIETVALGADNRVRYIGKTQPGHAEDSNWFDYANVAVIEPEFLRRIPDTQHRDIASVWATMIPEQKLYGCILNEGYWYNVGTPEEYERIQSLPL